MKPVFVFSVVAALVLLAGAPVAVIAQERGGDAGAVAQAATQNTVPNTLQEPVPEVIMQSTSPVKKSWRKTDDHWARKNSITVTATTMGFSNYTGLGFGHINLEYDRALPYNLSISAVGVYAPLPTTGTADAYTVFETFWFAGVKVNYNLPVVRNWLYLRIGAGIGVGIHDVSRVMFSGWFDEGPPPAPRKWVKPHAIVDVQWVFRATKWLELRFAPGLVSPSQFIVGSKFDDPYFRSPYCYYNMLGTLGVTVRF